MQSNTFKFQTSIDRIIVIKYENIAGCNRPATYSVITNHSSRWYSMGFSVMLWGAEFWYRKGTSIRQAPVFGTSEHYGKAHGSLLSGWMNYNYIACCWFPTSSNILILPSQLWQIRFESCWLHCSKCRILVFLRYLLNTGALMVHLLTLLFIMQNCNVWLRNELKMFIL